MVIESLVVLLLLHFHDHVKKRILLFLGNNNIRAFELIYQEHSVVFMLSVKHIELSAVPTFKRFVLLKNFPGTCSDNSAANNHKFIYLI